MLTLVFISIVLWLYLRWRWRSLIKLSKVFKHDLLSLPFLGISYLFIGDRKAVMRGIEKLGQEAYKHNGVISFWSGHHLFVLFADPDLANFVSKTCLEKHAIMKTCLKPLFRDSHLIAPVPMWRHRRKMVTPLFTTGKIKSYAPIQMEQSKILVDKLRSSAGNPVFILENIIKQNLEIMFQTSVDRKSDLQNLKKHLIVTGFEEVADIVGGRFFKPWLYNDFIFELLPESKVVSKIITEAYEFVSEALQLKRKSINEIGNSTANAAEVRSFVEQLLAAEKLDDREMTEELMGLVLAGTDTTAISTCFGISMLAYHPETQEKIYHEIMNELPPDFEANDLLNLKYLDAFIKETLRLYPPVPAVARTVDEDITLPTGVVLPKGCGILLHLSAINKNPKFWGLDAEVFRPERFLETQFTHPAQFAAFSLGPRNCIGYRLAIMSLKITISTVVRHLRVYPATDEKKEGANFELAYGITIKDDNNFPLIFKSRA